MFLSRELISLFSHCEVDVDTISDHAAVACHFHGGHELVWFALAYP